MSLRERLSGYRSGSSRLGGLVSNAYGGRTTPYGGIRGTIYSAAQKEGIDPYLALATVENEGGFYDDPNEYYNRVGDQGQSYGPYQEHLKGRGAQAPRDIDPVRQTQRFAADVRRLLESGFQGTPGQLIAAAQRPYDPIGAARKYQASYDRYSTGGPSDFGGGGGSTSFETPSLYTPSGEEAEGFDAGPQMTPEMRARLARANAAPGQGAGFGGVLGSLGRGIGAQLDAYGRGIQSIPENVQAMQQNPITRNLPFGLGPALGVLSSLPTAEPFLEGAGVGELGGINTLLGRLTGRGALGAIADPVGFLPVGKVGQVGGRLAGRGIRRAVAEIGEAVGPRAPTPLFHGTTATRAFDELAAPPGGVVYLSKDPNYAATYAVSAGETEGAGPRMFRVTLDPKAKVRKVNLKSIIGEVGESIGRNPDAAVWRYMEEKGLDAVQSGNIYMVRNPDMIRYSGQEATRPGLVQRLQANFQPLNKLVGSEEGFARIPDWLRQDLDRLVARADQMGVSDRIEELAAQRLPARQIVDVLMPEVKDITDVRELQTMVRAVRQKRGIPSLDEPAEFEAWLQGRKATPGPSAAVPEGELAQAAPTNPQQRAIARSQADEFLRSEGLAGTPEGAALRGRIYNFFEKGEANPDEMASIGAEVKRIREAQPSLEETLERSIAQATGTSLPPPIEPPKPPTATGAQPPSGGGQPPKIMAEVERKVNQLARGQQLGLGEVDPAFQKALNNLRKGKFSNFDKLQSYWISNVLSGPKTHIRNIVSNAVNGTLQIPIRGVRGALDYPISKLQGRPQEFFPDEALPSAMGFLQGMPEGFRKALHVLRNGFDIEDAAQFDRPAHYEFPGGIANPLNAGGRFLVASDAFAKSMAFQSELAALAVRKAIKAGLKGQAQADRIADLIESPTDDMLAGAGKFSHMATFTDEPGKITQTFLDIREKVPLARFIVPFVKTPGNIFRQGLALTPYGAGQGLVQLARRDPKAAETLAKGIIGSGMTAWGAAAFANGNLTGRAPTTPAQRDEFYRLGKQPYSIKIGDNWMDYRWLGPVAFPLLLSSVIGDSFMQGSDPEESAITAAALTVGSFLDMSFLRGFSDMVNAATDPVRYAEAWLASIAGGFNPLSGLQRNVAQAIDTIMRDPDDIWERIETGIPGLSQQVLTRQDVFGKDVERKGGSGLMAFLPAALPPDTPDPLTEQLVNIGVTPGFISDRLTIGTESIKMDSKTAHRYRQVSGMMVYDTLSKLLSDPTITSLPPEIQKKGVERVIDKVREKVRNEMKLELIEGGKVPSVPPLGTAPLQISTPVTRATMPPLAASTRVPATAGAPTRNSGLREILGR